MENKDGKTEYWRWLEYQKIMPDIDWKNAEIITAGVDVGSVGSKAVIILMDMALTYAAKTFSLDQPLRNSPTASVFAKTTHVLLTGSGSSVTLKDTLPTSSTGIFSRL